MAGVLITLRHAHDAMVRPIAAATHRQIRLAPAGHSQKRLNKRQAQQGQQRDGEYSLQYFVLKHSMEDQCKS